MEDSNATAEMAAVPTVTPVMPDPETTPLVAIMSVLSVSDLKGFVINRFQQGIRISYELRCALRELKSRCKGTGTWQKTLLECGIKPGTWRQWEFRETMELTTGKRTGTKKPKAQLVSCLDLAQAQADLAAAYAKVDPLRTSIRGPNPTPIKDDYLGDVPAPVTPGTALPHIIVTIANPMKSAVVDCDDRAASLWALFEHTQIGDFIDCMNKSNDFFRLKYDWSAYENSCFMLMWDSLPDREWQEEFLDSNRMTEAFKLFGNPADVEEFTTKYIEYALAIIAGGSSKQ